MILTDNINGNDSMTALESTDAWRAARGIMMDIGSHIILSTGMQSEKRFVQHGVTTTFQHSLDVATVAVMLALYAGIDDEKTIGNTVKAGLLHDYFLYDWHDNASWHRMHGFTHGRTAALNAVRDYRDDMNPVIVDSLIKHMFPLTASRPLFTEGWLISIADKVCASRETFTRKRFGSSKDEWLRNHAKMIAMFPVVPSEAKPVAERIADGELDGHVVRLNAYKALAYCRDLKHELKTELTA